MEERDIKREFDEEECVQCRSCLSVGRKLLPLGEYTNIYNKITSECDYQCPAHPEVQICWECHALLRRIISFQRRAFKAKEILQLGQNYIYGTLSSLTTIILNDKNPNTIYINDQTNIVTNADKHKSQDVSEVYPDDDITENNDAVESEYSEPHDMENGKTAEEKADRKTKNSNRWAKKRALQNKKPKFKIVTQVELKMDIRRVQIDDAELQRCLEQERGSEYYKSKRYKCEKCVIGFNNERLMIKHHKNRHKHQGQFSCAICSTHYSDKRHLSAHVRKHYYKYICPVCKYTCNGKGRIYQHLEREHRRVFQCLKCQLKFRSRREFFQHFKEWHEKFVCDHCGVSFKMRYCIKDHIRKQHSPFECKRCEKRFSRYNGLWLHNKTRHGTGLAAYCVECDKRYPDVYRYRWHLANSAKHTPRKRRRIPCPGCDKVFSKNIYMKDHYNLVHLKYYKYRCEECDKNFIRNADLVKHKRRVHEGVLPPKNKICYVCGRGFTTNKILTNHVRTHTGERPFACAACPARFAQSNALAGHQRALHPLHSLHSHGPRAERPPTPIPEAIDIPK